VFSKVTVPTKVDVTRWKRKGIHNVVDTEVAGKNTMVVTRRWRGKAQKAVEFLINRWH
jgi:hypothetical protein